MKKFENPFGFGIQLLSKSEANDVDLGPLAGLQGAWEAQPGQGWNVISVPGTGSDGFVLEVIPYKETLTFTPVVTAGNRGPVVDGVQQDQQLVGLLYEQIITSVCTSDFCNERGFSNGTMIHAERGIFLNVTNFNNNLDVVRLSTIPHGNSVLALGQAQVGVPPTNDFFGTASTIPTDMQGRPILDYGLDQFDNEQFPDFDQKNPNTFLRSSLGNEKILSMTTLILSTNHTDGGILNIPFIQQNVNTTSLDSTFWIERIQGANGNPDFDQLQYTQSINLVFPPTGSTTPVIWPHVTISTLQRPSTTA